MCHAPTTISELGQDAASELGHGHGYGPAQLQHLGEHCGSERDDARVL